MRSQPCVTYICCPHLDLFSHPPVLGAWTLPYSLSSGTWSSCLYLGYPRSCPLSVPLHNWVTPKVVLPRLWDVKDSHDVALLGLWPGWVTTPAAQQSGSTPLGSPQMDPESSIPPWVEIGPTVDPCTLQVWTAGARFSGFFH